MKIVFFDGYCHLCNSQVDWLIRIDKTKELKFSPLQGETAARLLAGSEKLNSINSIIYLRDKKKYDRSTAILFILADSGSFWRWTCIFFVIPKFLRDFIYNIIANNRYRIFGKRELCRMPSASDRDRMLP